MSMGCVYTTRLNQFRRKWGLSEVYPYRRGLSALLVLQYRAMREPLDVGRAAGMFPRFFCARTYKLQSFTNTLQNWERLQAK